MESQQLLWQHVFKDEQLIIRLIKEHAAVCSKNSLDSLQESKDEITIESSKWGPIKLKIWAATALGDNFLSDAYIASAKLDNGKVEYRSFIKVSHPSLMYNQNSTFYIHSFLQFLNLFSRFCLTTTCCS